jgi:signal transduction histidine kinase
VRRTLSFKIYGTSVLIMTLLFAVESGIFFLFERASVMQEFSADLTRVKDRVSASLVQPVWILSFDQIKTIIELELENESLSYIVVVDERGEKLFGGMRFADGSIGPYDALKVDRPKVAENVYYTDLVFDGKAIGSVEIGATREYAETVVADRFVMVIIRALVVVLVGLLFVAFMIRYYVVRPLSELRVTVKRFANRDFYTRADDVRDDEIGDLSKSFNSMADTIHEYSKNLEQLVTSRTNQLLESEKLALLGSLVAGVAHEINTPVGIGVTAASHAEELTAELSRAFDDGSLSKSQLQAYIRESKETAEIIKFNLSRASDFVKSFKQIAVDQSSEERRLFDLREYVEEIVFSLRPKLKKTPHRVVVEVPEGIRLLSYPGMFSQIFTNLIVNSLNHAFDGGRVGTMRVGASVQGDYLVIEYSDDGKGIPRDSLAKVFLPFFTTAREHGGTGLGLYLIYNIVTKLGGSIRCASEAGQGVVFTIALPKDTIMSGESPT